MIFLNKKFKKKKKKKKSELVVFGLRRTHRNLYETDLQVEAVKLYLDIV